MKVKLLKSKIHRAVVTQADLDYVGSISIDTALLKASGLYEFEKVHVLDITNGARLETYVIEGEQVGQIGINGPAALKMCIGDIIIIVSYAMLEEELAQNFRPTIVFPTSPIKR